MSKSTAIFIGPKAATKDEVKAIRTIHNIVASHTEAYYKHKTSVPGAIADKLVATINKMLASHSTGVVVTTLPKSITKRMKINGEWKHLIHEED